MREIRGGRLGRNERHILLVPYYLKSAEYSTLLNTYFRQSSACGLLRGNELLSCCPVLYCTLCVCSVCISAAIRLLRHTILLFAVPLNKFLSYNISPEKLHQLSGPSLHIYSTVQYTHIHCSYAYCRYELVFCFPLRFSNGVGVW